jgi:hypothetical protein
MEIAIPIVHGVSYRWVSYEFDIAVFKRNHKPRARVALTTLVSRYP